MTIRVSSEVLSIIRDIQGFFSHRQVKAYLVGGFIRDLWVERSTADIDIAVTENALAAASDLADKINGKYVLLDEVNRVARVVLGSDVLPNKSKWYIDVSTVSGDIQQDLRRRDFTINAMAIDLESLVFKPGNPEIIDPVDGQNDLRRRLINAVSESTFKDDPVRLLRAVRLAAELGFNIEEKTEALIRDSHRLIAQVAGERIREELLRILATPQAGKCIRYLDDLDLLTSLIPELEPARGVEQPREHHWDVLNHSLESVRAVEFLLGQSQPEYTSKEIQDAIPWSEKLDQHFAAEVGNGSTHASLLKLAALLHDIAKPETKIIAEERMRFFGHTDQGAEVAAKILERLRFSNKEIKLVEMMVRSHMRPTQMSHEGMPTKRAVYRYFRDTGTAGIDILYLSLADHLAARGPDLDVAQWKQQAQVANSLLTDCFHQNGEIAPLKLIDGHDLIKLFGLKPGPEIRKILEAIKESQATGEVTTREEALSYVKNHLLYREENLS